MVPHQRILDHVESQRQNIIDLCSALVQRPSPNPPGDTRAPAQVIRDLLEVSGLPVESESDQAHTPNLISTLWGAGPGRHIVLIGHMDTYPVGDLEQWSRPPFEGIVHKGRLHGIGAGDMKGGLTALTYAYITMAKLGGFNGRLTLLAVSDEMNFSPHGARMLLGRRPDLLGDAVLDSEPTSPDFVLFGEKGMVWIEIVCRGKSAHGSYAARATNAIEEMATVLSELKPLRDWQVTLPPDVAGALQAGGGTRGMDPAALTYANDDLLPQVSVNFGLIRGGRKINMVADECRAEVDIRLPPGLETQRILDFLDKVFSGHSSARYQVIQTTEPTWSDPNAELFRFLVENVMEVTGTRPRLEIGVPASDTRLFRLRGIPAAMVGPRVENEGAPNESIPVDDLITCTKAFALTANDYLNTPITLPHSAR
jgi:succinyl-diaminopimelate desuccinylase